MDLLDTIASSCGCIYLSDLSYAQLRHYFPSLLLYHVEKIPASRFPARQWLDAHVYMTGADFSGQDAVRCRQSLLDILNAMYINAK